MITTEDKHSHSDEKTKKYHDELISLLELEFDALEAYKATVNRLDNQAFKAKIRDFQGDHERHIHDLTQLIKSYHMEPPKGPTMKSMLTQGKVVIGGLIGDNSILKAMLTNELDTNKAYQHMCQFTTAPSSDHAIFEKGLADEKKHKAWIESVIE